MIKDDDEHVVFVDHTALICGTAVNTSSCCRYFIPVSYFEIMRMVILTAAVSVRKHVPDAKMSGDMPRKAKRALLTLLEPHSHMWGHFSLNIGSLSPKRDWGPKRVKGLL